jgi:hypothetical protein
MAGRAYVFRVESLTFDQQRTDADNTDDDILTIFVKVDDSPLYTFSTRLAAGILSSFGAGLGKLAQTAPIYCESDSIVSTLYLITNVQGSPAEFDLGQYKEAISVGIHIAEDVASLWDIDLDHFGTAIEDGLTALGWLRDEPNCLGPTFLATEQYLGSRLFEMTENYSVHRPPTIVSDTLTTQDGCGAPQTGVNIAVERVPPVINAVWDGTRIQLIYSVPYKAPVVGQFDTTKPPGRSAAWKDIGGEVLGEVAYSHEAGITDFFGIGVDGASIWHKWSDANGWHDWEQLPGAAGGGAITTVHGYPYGSLELFATGTDGGLWHAHMGTDRSSDVIWDRAPLTNNVVGAPCVVMSPTGAWTVFAVMGSTDTFTSNVLGDYRELGGYIAWLTWSSADGWTDHTLEDPTPDQNAFFRSMGGSTITGATLGGFRNAGIATPLDTNLVAIGRDGAVHASLGDVPGGPFEGYSGTELYNLGGAAIYDPAVAVLRRPDGLSRPSAYLFVVGTDHGLYMREWISGWNDPAGPGAQVDKFYRLGGKCIGRPAVVELGWTDPPVVYVFVIGMDEQVYWLQVNEADGPLVPHYSDVAGPIVSRPSWSVPIQWQGAV